MTLAAMRYHVDVAELQSQKLNLIDRYDRENQANHQLKIIVRSAYNTVVLRWALIGLQ